MDALTLPLPAAGTAPRTLPSRLGGARLRVAGDQRLTQLAQEGDTRAFEAIFERHHQALYRYCRSIVRSPEDAADALQNTMLKAMLALPAKKAEVVLKPWLYRIAHNEAVTILRRRRPHEEITEARGPIAPGTEVDADRRARLRELLTDLDDLPERQRAALVMRELNGLEFAEIGLAFGVSPAAAKQAVYEARTALHERVEGRDMSCDSVRRSLSGGDGRIARGRKIRSHLGDCAACRDFRETMAVRRGDLAALAPPLEAGAAAAILHSLLGGGGGGGGLGGGLVAGLGKVGSASGVFKAAAVAASLVAGAGATGLGPGGALDRLPVPVPAAASGVPGLETLEPVSRLLARPVPAFIPVAALVPLTELADAPERPPARVGETDSQAEGTTAEGTTAAGSAAGEESAPLPVVTPPALGPRVPGLPLDRPPLPVDAPSIPLPGGVRPDTPGVPAIEPPPVGVPDPGVGLPQVRAPIPGDILK